MRQSISTALPTPTTASAKRRDSAFHGLRRAETIAGYLFVLANLLGFLLFNALPIVAAFALSATAWDLSTTTGPQWVGLQNFGQIWQDDLALKTLRNTFYYSFAAVPSGVFVAFCLALLLNRKIPGRLFFRFVYFVPYITLSVAIAIVWKWLYHPDLGLFNYLLAFVGIKGPNWLFSTTWAMPAVIILSNWRGIGYAMLIFLAGLQGIPEEYYEAATIDGATSGQKLRHITLPLLSPTTFFVLVTSFIGAFQGFDQFYLLTNGGPAFSTTTLVLYIYNNGFGYFKMGYAAALAVALFVIILIITLIQWRVSKNWVYGAEE